MFYKYLEVLSLFSSLLCLCSPKYQKLNACFIHPNGISFWIASCMSEKYFSVLVLKSNVCMCQGFSCLSVTWTNWTWHLKIATTSYWWESGVSISTPDYNCIMIWFCYFFYERLIEKQLHAAQYLCYWLISHTILHNLYVLIDFCKQYNACNCRWK